MTRPGMLSRQAVALATLFVVAAAASNWAIENVGRDNGPLAPRTISIGWGLEAPSGVVLIGMMIAVRDALHERVGLRGTIVVIAIASLVSAVLAPPALAIASGVTLLVAEITDALVYQQLRRRGRIVAATASNVASSIVDSALFLTIAYGAHAAAGGTWTLTLGKFEASLATLALVALFGRPYRRSSAAVA